MAWQHGIGELRREVAAQVPELVRRRRVPPDSARRRSPAGTSGARAARLEASSTSAATPTPHAPGSPVVYGSRSPSSARPTSSSVRSSVSGEGIFPEELVKEFRYLRDKRAGRVLRGRAPRRRSGTRQAARGGVRQLLGRAARRRVDRAGAHREPQDRRDRRGKGAAARPSPTLVQQGPRRDGVDLAGARRADPDLCAGQSARARRSVRGDDRGGTRLPSRSPEHARRGHGARRRPTSGRSWCRARIPNSSPGACWSWNGSTGSASKTSRA